MKKHVNIVIPDDAIIVRRDSEESSLIYLTNPELKDTGVVIYTGFNHKKLKDLKVRFKEANAEKLELNGEEVLFFRYADTSLYYTFDEESKG